MATSIYVIRGPFGEFVSYEWANSPREAIEKMLGPDLAEDENCMSFYDAQIED